MRPEEISAIIEKLRFAAKTLEFVRADLAVLKVNMRGKVELTNAGELERKRAYRTPGRVSHLTLKKRIENGVVSAEVAIREALSPTDWIE